MSPAKRILAALAVAGGLATPAAAVVASAAATTAPAVVAVANVPNTWYHT